jgi:hypothetical protein
MAQRNYCSIALWWRGGIEWEHPIPHSKAATMPPYISVDTRNVAGHRDAGPEHWHFLGRGCIECDAHTLAGSPLDRVDNWYRHGVVGQDAFEAYMHVWTTSATHFRYYGDWTPVNDRVRQIADAIRAALTLRQAAAD